MKKKTTMIPQIYKTCKDINLIKSNIVYKKQFPILQKEQKK